MAALTAEQLTTLTDLVNDSFTGDDPEPTGVVDMTFRHRWVEYTVQVDMDDDKALINPDATPIARP